MGDGSLHAIYHLLRMRTFRTADEIHHKREQISDACEGGEVERFEMEQVRPMVESVKRLAPDIKEMRWLTISKVGATLDNNSEGRCLKTILIVGGTAIFKRKLEPKGPLVAFGYDYFEDKAKAAGIATPRLMSYEGLWGSGEEYAYEVLNFADGNRNTQQIRDAVSAEYGPVPLGVVVEYLKALEKIDIVEEVK